MRQVRGGSGEGGKYLAKLSTCTHRHVTRARLCTHTHIHTHSLTVWFMQSVACVAASYSSAVCIVCIVCILCLLMCLLLFHTVYKRPQGQNALQSVVVDPATCICAQINSPMSQQCCNEPLRHFSLRVWYMFMLTLHAGVSARRYVNEARSAVGRMLNCDACGQFEMAIVMQHTHVCAHASTHVCAHACIHTCTHARALTQTRTWARTRTHKHTCMHTYTLTTNPNTHKHTHTQARTHTHTHTHSDNCINHTLSLCAFRRCHLHIWRD